MIKRYFPAIMFLFFAVSPALSAQDVSSPHVSQIRAEPRNNLIRLTWRDSPDAQGPVYIFRSTRSFSGAIPPNIRPVVVRYGVQYYVDDADDIENLFYFIAASDASGRRYDVIIPQINSVSVNTSAPALLAVPERTAPEPVQGISNLRARQDGERVIITFDVSGPRKNAVLYRSRQPVRQPRDLLDAVVVQSGIASPFADFPVSGIAWYYAAVYEDEISGGSFEIRPGVNATASAVTISGAPSARPDVRPIPLPLMTLQNALPDGFFMTDVTEYIPLGEDSARMLRNSQLPSKEPLPLKRPRVFVVDLQSPSGGEESALFQIVNDFFVKRDWEGCRENLLHYLSLPRSRDAEARARFYLGQTFYFTGNYREALFEFLSIRSVYPAEANVWIDVILAAMVH